jgi:very-short-patch-repair endonuclease
MASARAVKSRKFRQAQTLAERRAWYLLSNRSVMGLKFRRQQPIDHYTVDFYCPELRLALELDGGVHSQPSQVKRDKPKYEYLSALGIQVARIPNGLAMEDPEGFIRKIAELTPHPPGQAGAPSPARGEGQDAQ